jgi:hypothetical protein
MKITNRVSFGVVVFIAIVFTTVRLNYYPTRILSYDVFGYYLYLPSLIIHHDPGLHDIGWINEINEKYPASPSLYQISQTSEGNWAIRFNTGMAFLYAPFFLCGHLFALFSPYPADGFSLPYQWALIISGIFYTLLGVWFMRKLLLELFSDQVAAITLFLLFIGSSLFFFSTFGNDAPHVYIFTLVTILIYLTILWHRSPKAITAAGIGLLAGLISMCRASGFLVILIPLFWGIGDLPSLKEKIRLIARNYKHVVIVVVCTIIAFLPQILYWKVNTGHFIYNAYDDPQSGFNFSNPRFGYVLFGFRKGFYLYSLMMIFATIGFIQLYRSNRSIFLPALLFFLANVYLIASYSSLVSYGWRAFIEVHAILAIPLGYFTNSILQYRKIPKYSLLILLFAFTIINLTQAYKIANGVIDGSRMTKDYYLATFFKMESSPADRELLLVDRTEETREYFSDEDKYQKRNFTVMDFDNMSRDDDPYVEDSIVFRGKYSYRLDSLNLWSPALKVPYKDITSEDHAWIRLGVQIYPTDANELNSIRLVTDFCYKGKVYKYRAFTFNDFGLRVMPGQWNLLTYDYLTPEVRTADDTLEVYIWNLGKSTSFIDDLTVDVFEKKTLN